MTPAWLLQDFATVHLNNNTAPEESEQEHSLPCVSGYKCIHHRNVNNYCFFISLGTAMNQAGSQIPDRRVKIAKMELASFAQFFASPLSSARHFLAAG